jgi:aldose 1-epimerase
MEIYTAEPSLQFYSGNKMQKSIEGKSGHEYRQRYGFCLEPQHFPDSPHKPNFPSVVLCTDELYRQTSIYKFYVS